MPLSTHSIKDMFDKVSFTAVIIVYLFACGGLYIVGYWGSFNLDVSPFISITDVPKSFFLPFNNSGSVVALLIIGVVLLILTKLITWLKGFFKWFFIIVTTIALIIYSILGYTDWPYKDVENFNIGFVLTILFIASVILAEFFASNKLSMFSKYVIILIISIPAFCYLRGTEMAESVKSYHNSLRAEPLDNSPTLESIKGAKFVGYVGDKVIFIKPIKSDPNIKDTFFIIDQEKLGALKLTPGS